MKSTVLFSEWNKRGIDVSCITSILVILFIIFIFLLKVNFTNYFVNDVDQSSKVAALVVPQLSHYMIVCSVLIIKQISCKNHRRDDVCKVSLCYICAGDLAHVSSLQ